MQEVRQGKDVLGYTKHGMWSTFDEERESKRQ